MTELERRVTRIEAKLKGRERARKRERGRFTRFYNAHAGRMHRVEESSENQDRKVADLHDRVRVLEDLFTP